MGPDVRSVAVEGAHDSGSLLDEPVDFGVRYEFVHFLELGIWTILREFPGGHLESEINSIGKCLRRYAIYTYGVERIHGWHDIS